MRTKPQLQDTGLYVFPNCTTGALMAVKYPVQAGWQVERLLRKAHADRANDLSPSQALTATVAAKKLGISRRTLQRWVARGWIYAWSKWGYDLFFDFSNTPYLFSRTEVEAHCLAKPCDL
ncbi:MAG: hypothetical protein ACRYFX_22280 [Janthinobacterium lividum]